MLCELINPFDFIVTYGELEDRGCCRASETLKDGKENLNDHFTSSQPIWLVTTVCTAQSKSQWLTKGTGRFETQTCFIYFHFVMYLMQD